MNIEQAKSIQLANFLQRLGYEPARRRQSELWYLSPLRSESTPSFKINQTMNAWYDFGEGFGGDIIDLVKRLENLGSTSEALARIESLVGSDEPPIHHQSSQNNEKQEAKIELDKVGPVKAKALFAYLRRRGLVPELLEGHIFEANYKIQGRSFYGLAFPSDSGAYEIRNPMFKGTIGAKDITTVAGDPKHVAVFEGFFDYLTAIMLNGKPLSQTVIVLNSVALKVRALERLKFLNPDSIDVYHDTDSPGRAICEYLRQSLPNIKVISKANLYTDYKDINEWYIGKQLSQQR